MDGVNRRVSGRAPSPTAARPAAPGGRSGPPRCPRSRPRRASPPPRPSASRPERRRRTRRRRPWDSVELGRSSAVPVLPATSTPGIAAAVPVPERTTPSIISRTCAATRALTTRRRRTLSLRTIRGRARRPRSAIVAPAAAICSGVARSRSWPMALAPTARLSFSSRGRRDRARLGVGHARALVEAERLGHAHQAGGAELRAERREDRVARVDERLRQRAAARLAARRCAA